MVNAIDNFLKDLRNNHVPTPAEINTFFQIPLVYELREKLNDDDLNWLLCLAKNPDARNDTISLLTGWAMNPAVWDWANDEWEKASTFEWKQGLLWLLTENPDFDVSARREAASWLMSNLGPFLTLCARWWETPAERLGRVKSSLCHRGRPKEKAFVYLCVGMGASDRDGLRTLLVQYAEDTDDTDPVAIDVARRLLSLLDAAEKPL